VLSAEETHQPSPLQLKEEARIAFLAQHMLSEPEQFELNHISALLALLIEGEWVAASVTRLLAKTVPKKNTPGIRGAWNPYLSHPPSHPKRVP
jgi:hypothetical protein